MKPLNSGKLIKDGQTYIAIQGLEGSFHHSAALKYFGKKAKVAVCSSFREVVTRTCKHNEISAGIIAIENTTVGSILPNYQLLENNPVQIVGEINLRINQNLIANRGVCLDDIREVHSHPMALQQCSEYLTQYPHWKLVESQDTAFSVNHIKQSQSKSIACIAGAFAATLFGLPILKKQIQTEKFNLTRFLVLQNDFRSVVEGNENKASVLFWINHSKGSLVKVLQILSREGINLSNLQSVSIPGSHFLYSFHTDWEFSSLKQFETAVKKIKPHTTKLKIYGIYTKESKVYRV